MTDRLRDVFADLLDDEPPMRLAVPVVMAAGRRRLGRRRRVVVGTAIGALVAFGAAGTALAVRTEQPPVVADRNVTDASVLPAASGSSTAPASRGPTATTLPDPGFEHSPPGWATFGPETVLTPVGTARSGRRALRITTTVTRPEVAGATNRPVLVKTVVGARYTATCWARSSSPIDAYVKLQEYTADWQRAGDPAASAPVRLADPARWYQVTVTYTAARTGSQLPLTVYTDDLRGGAGALLVDDCSLTVGP